MIEREIRLTDNVGADEADDAAQAVGITYPTRCSGALPRTTAGVYRSGPAGSSGPPARVDLGGDPEQGMPDLLPMGPRQQVLPRGLYAQIDNKTNEFKTNAVTRKFVAPYCEIFASAQHRWTVERTTKHHITRRTTTDICTLPRYRESGAAGRYDRPHT